MLKTRVISAIIGLILLFVVFFSGQGVLGLVVFALALIGVNEYYNAISNAGYKPIRLIGYLLSIPILLIGFSKDVAWIGKYLQSPQWGNYLSFSCFISIVFLFSIIIFLHHKYNLLDIALTVFGAFYVVFLFSFVVLTRNLDNGFYLVWIIFIGAWSTDTFAYFAGVNLGKTKFLPAISASKTLEGSAGGVIGCVAITMLYGWYLNSYHLANSIPLVHFAAMGILNGIIAQIGDWSASAIKRYVKIKDYGKVMPGHGGVLDRFDSILFIAPVVYFYISFII